MNAAALAVMLGDGGPVLFKQTRVGKDGVGFELLKLRTMVVGGTSTIAPRSPLTLFALITY